MMRVNARVAWIIVICVALVGMAAGIARYFSSPEQSAGRRQRREAREQRDLFIARFDSLCEAKLYPVVWRSGTFTRTGFDPDRRAWTLTVSSTDWYRRTETSKRDLAARLLTAFRAVRAQAGGDSEDAVLVIKDDNDERVAECTPSGGVKIDK
jgi:hypothetical protein